MLAAAQRAAGGVFLTFPEDLRPLSAIDYIMYCHSRYVPTSEVGGAEKRKIVIFGLTSCEALDIILVAFQRQQVAKAVSPAEDGKSF